MCELYLFSLYIMTFLPGVDQSLTPSIMYNGVDVVFIFMSKWRGVM